MEEIRESLSAVNMVSFAETMACQEMSKIESITVTMLRRHTWNFQALFRDWICLIVQPNHIGVKLL